MKRIYRFITASLLALLSLEGCTPQAHYHADVSCANNKAIVHNNNNDIESKQSDTKPTQPATTGQGMLLAKGHVSTSKPAAIGSDGVALFIDSGAVNGNVDISILATTEANSGTIPEHMQNLTPNGAVYRMLPDGQKFEKDITIAMHYDSTALPYGYTADDIYTFFYNEQTALWQKVERDSVDTERQIVYSRTNHFTDYINGVLKVPENSDVASYTPTSISDLKAADPMEGITLIAPPEANNQGTANLSYPLSIPAGRNGMQPNLSVNYSSAGGSGILGIGWSLPISEISVDTRRGVPLFDNTLETETYALDGDVLVTSYTDANGLMHLNKPAYASPWKSRVTTGELQFYPRVEGSFRRIVRHGTSPSNYYWVVTDKNGTKYFYGLSDNGRLKDAAGHIARWCLQRVEDSYGNTVTYNYTTRIYTIPGSSNTARQILLSNISYIGNRSTRENGHYNLKFNYSSSDKYDAQTSARFGFLEADAALLDRIDVMYDREPIRHYVFGYKEGSFGKTLLCNIVDVDPQTLTSGNVDCTGDTNSGYSNYHRPQLIFEGDSAYFAWLDSLRNARIKDERNYFYPDTDRYDDYRLIDSDYYSDHQIHGRVVNTPIFIRDVYDRCSAMDSTCMHYAYNEHRFEYSGVPLAMLSPTEYIVNANNSRDNLQGPLFLTSGSPGPIEGTGTKSWNVGGAIDVGFGFNTFLKSITVGGGYTYTNNKTEGLVNLVDLNGDGLSDKIYKRGSHAYYRLRDNYNPTQFLEENRIYGTDTFLFSSGTSDTWVVEGSVGATGLGVSFGLNWNYGNTATSTYLSDVDGDGLPDLVNRGSVLYNRINDDNYNVFLPAEDNGGFMILSSCGREDTIWAGEPVDPWVFEDFVDSTYWIYDTIYDEKGRIIGIDSVPFTYTVPRPYRPDLENVRFWQAPHEGYVYLSDSARMLPAPVMPGDGVRLIVQHEMQNHNYYVINDTLRPDMDTVFLDTVIHVNMGDRIYYRALSMGTRLADRFVWDPTIEYCDQWGNVSSSYNSIWIDDDRYSYREDFLLSGLQRIQIPFDATIEVEAEAYDRNGGSPASATRLQVLKNGNEILGFNINGSSSYASNSFSVSKNDVIQVRVKAAGLIDWSTIEASSHIYITSNDATTSPDMDIPVEDNLSDPNETRYYFDYYPQIQKLVYNNACDTNTVYMYPGYSAEQYSQFGTMYRNWGQFAYKIPQNAPNDFLDRNLLFDAQMNSVNGSGSSAYDNVQNNVEVDVDIDNVESDVSVGGLGAYNPLAGSFFVMQSDFKHNCWTAYSDYAYIERTMLSNTPHPADGMTIADVDRTECESTMPIYSPTATVVSKETHHNSFGICGNVSVGIPILGFSGGLGWTKSEQRQLADMLDLNGDGLPDVLSEVRVQYSQPFGGLSNLKGSIFDDHRYAEHSFDTINNGSFGGSFLVSLYHTANSVRHTTKGISAGVGANMGGSEAHGTAGTTWVDFNGDGLPDKAYLSAGKVCYYPNVGYGFLPRGVEFATGDVRHTHSKGESGGASLSAAFESTWLNREGAALNDLANSLPDSLESVANWIRGLLDDQRFNNQLNVSITAGFGASTSWNKNDVITIDLNGDGLPDRLVRYGNAYYIEFNNGNSFARSNAELHVAKEYDNVSFGTDLTGAITAGVTFGFIPLKIEGNPKGGLSRGLSRTIGQWADMNGDGVPDYIWDAGDNYIGVRYSNLGVANRLVGVTLPTGGHYAMRYTLNENDGPESNRRYYVLDSLSITDNRMAAPAICRKFEYYDRHYDRIEREDYGYAQVVTTEGESASSIPHYRMTVCDYHNQDFLFKGLCYQTMVVNPATGNPLTKQQNDYRLMEIASGDLIPGSGPGCYGDGYPAIYETTSTTYNAPSPTVSLSSRIRFGYTSYANIDTVYDFGATNDPSDDYVAVSVYTSIGDYIVSPVVEEKVMVGSSVLRHRGASYNNRGSVLRIKFYNAPEPLSDYDFDYDTYGNVQKVTYPRNHNGDRFFVEYIYDNNIHSLPVKTYNAYGLISYAEYDYRFQTPVWTKSASGGQADYRYDSKGRLSELYAPFEFGTNTPTIRYEYYDRYMNHDYYWHHLRRWARTLNHNQGTDYIATVTISDGLGRPRVVKKESEVGGVNCRVVGGWTTFDGIGRVVRQYHPYTEAMTTPDSTLNTVFNTPFSQMGYDLLDRTVITTMPDGATTTAAFSVATEPGGTMLRNKVVTTDPEGNVSQTFTNVRGQNTVTVTPLGATTVYAYDHIGQLQSVKDPEGNYTTNAYDLLGRRTSRDHPSAGHTVWNYDPAGNLVRQTQNSGRYIDFNYQYNRPVNVRYSDHHANNVAYKYGNMSDGTAAGRVILQQDATGVQQFKYDYMGNVIDNCHTYVQPGSPHTFTLNTQWKYDSWGRVRYIIYPDKEEVRYCYDLGGKVNHIEGQKPGHPLYVYIDKIHYDEFDQRTIEVDGNGIESHYSYNPLNRRLVNLVDYSNPMGTVLQDNNYDYDAVGNIISIVDNGLNQRSQDFTYDAQYRLIHSKGSLNLGFDAVYYDNYYKYSPAGRLINKSVSSTRANNIMGVYPMDYDNDYEYGNPDNPYATDHIHDNMGNDHDLEWDADGNLIHSTTHMPFVAQHHCWTEDNRLQAYSRISDDDGNMAAWYNYNAGGDRNFKLTTPQTRMRQNADVFRSGAALAYPTLYASSLVTVNKNGYTKHYFEGSRRVCSKIGGGFASVDQQYTDSQMPEIDESYFEQYVAQNENLMTTFSECLGVNPQLDVYHDLYDVIMHEHGRDDSEPAFFYHSDHLGSAAYLTNDAGQVTQTLNYLPYGEDWVDIQNFAETQYPRLGIYSFNGKEKDYESGYHYYGARYYWSELLTGWLSVDPMMDKYPGISPYNYCAWNPVNVVDPNGMDTINIKYNTDDNKWEISKPILAKGNDVFNVTYADGNTVSTVFSEENYGERMCVLNLEEAGNCTLGVFHISGEDDDWATGFVATPKGDPSLVPESYRRLPDDTYPLSPTIGTGFDWVQPIVHAGRQIKIHPTGNSTIEWSDVEQWTKGCYVVGTKYKLKGDNVFFNPDDSRNTSKELNVFLGASKTYTKVGNKGYPGAQFSNGMKKMSLIQKGGKFRK